MSLVFQHKKGRREENVPRKTTLFIIAQKFYTSTAVSMSLNI